MFDQQRAPERALTHLPEHFILIHLSDEEEDEDDEEEDEEDGLLRDGQDARERERRVPIATRQQRHDSITLSGFDELIYLGDHGFDKAYFIQLLILTGTF